MFTVKKNSYTLAKYAVNHLKGLNINPVFEGNDVYDQRFINTLLVSFVSVQKLKNFETEDAAIQLIRGNFCLKSMAVFIQNIYLTNYFIQFFQNFMPFESRAMKRDSTDWMNLCEKSAKNFPENINFTRANFISS